MKIDMAMTANDKFREACKTADIGLLKEAVQEGADVNMLDDVGDMTCFEQMIYMWGSCWNYYQEDFKDNPEPRWTDEHMIEFSKILVENGFNLNQIHRDGNESFSVFWNVAKWGHSLPLLESLFRLGMDANHMDRDFSMLDRLEEDVFADGVCGYLEDAKDLYDAIRLSIAYGALPGVILGRQYEHGRESYYEAAIRLDADYLRECMVKKPGEKIGADRLMAQYGKYGYPKEFYYEPEKYQARLAAALDTIIPVTGIENLDKHVLDECVDQQFDIVLEHLLELGANPNVNCFTPSYSYIRSSALYTVSHEAYLFDPEKARKMKRMLLDAGARN